MCGLLFENQSAHLVNEGVSVLTARSSGSESPGRHLLESRIEGLDQQSVEQSNDFFNGLLVKFLGRSPSLEGT